MDEIETLTAESLRTLSYFDLQKFAKKRGIKANVKADKLITAIVSEREKTLMNVSLLNEVAKKKDVLSDECTKIANSSGRAHRRRTRTFSIEKPFCDMNGNTPVIAENCNSTPVKSTKKDVKSILSCNKRGKFSKSRNGNCFRVSFISPDRNEKSGIDTPIASLSSVRNRPKTPSALKYSNSAKCKRDLSTSPIAEISDEPLRTPSTKGLRTGEIKCEKAKLTFCAKGNKSGKISPFSSPIKGGIEPGSNEACTPMKMVPLASPIKKEIKLGSNRARTPNFRQIHKRVFEKMESLEEYQQRKKGRIWKLGNSCTKRISKDLSKEEKKENSKPATMNLRSRKICTSKIPVPSQRIRFKPSVTSIQRIDTNFSSKSLETQKNPEFGASKNVFKDEKFQPSVKTTVSKDKVFRFGKETACKMHVPLMGIINTPQNNKSLVHKRMFDLKASLAKKLPYKPYRGALKPLLDANVNERTVSSDITSVPHSRAVVKKRENTRNVLKGVRKNRRFELQMNHRGLST